MPSKKKISFIGLWILLAFVLLYFGISYLKGLDVFRNSYTYYVRFANVSSVAIASPVRINGYKVGNVQKLDFQLEEGATTVVALSIAKSHRIPEDTEASINQGLLGGSEIALAIGKSTEYLQHGDTLKASKGNPDYIEMLNDEVIPQVMAMLPKADSILSAVNALANDPSLPQTIQELNSTIATAHKTASNLKQMSGDIALFTKRELPELTTKLHSFSDNLLALSGAVDSLQLASIAQNLAETTSSLKAISTNLQTSLESDANTAGALLNEKDLYIRIDSLVHNADQLIQDIKANPEAVPQNLYLLKEIANNATRFNEIR